VSAHSVTHLRIIRIPYEPERERERANERERKIESRPSARSATRARRVSPRGRNGTRAGAVINSFRPFVCTSGLHLGRCSAMSALCTCQSYGTDVRSSHVMHARARSPAASSSSSSMKYGSLFLSLFLSLSLSLSLSLCFQLPVSRAPRLHLHFNKRRGKRTVRRAFSLARGENEGTEADRCVASTSRASSQLRESISRGDEAKRCACYLTGRKQPCISLSNPCKRIQHA